MGNENPPGIRSHGKQGYVRAVNGTMGNEIPPGICSHGEQSYVSVHIVVAESDKGLHPVSDSSLSRPGRTAAGILGRGLNDGGPWGLSRDVLGSPIFSKLQTHAEKSSMKPVKPGFLFHRGKLLARHFELGNGVLHVVVYTA